VACEQKFPDRRAFDEHRPGCPRAAPHTPTLPPPGGPSAVHTGSRLHFYCLTCKRDVPMDEQDAHNTAHQAQEKLGPLPPSEGGKE
jgi:hypothetical protein